MYVLELLEQWVHVLFVWLGLWFVLELLDLVVELVGLVHVSLQLLQLLY